MDGKRGYLFTKFRVASYDGGAADCPDGLALNLQESQAALMPADRRPSTKDLSVEKVVGLLLRQGDTYAGHNVCSAPTEYPFTGFRTIDRGGPARGLNLDGTEDGRATPSTCSHRKFQSSFALEHIDNQLWRAIGCISGFRPNGVTELSSGAQAWSVLMEVSEPKNQSGDVDVDFWAGEDVVTLGADGKVIPGESIQAKADPRYHTVAHGRLVGNVLTTDPVNFQYHVDVQVMHEDPRIRAARVRLEFLPNGKVSGLMGGYFDIEDFYKTRIVGMTLGGAIATGANCPALYSALHELADGYRDPGSGQCTALSGAMAIEGLPVFVIHPDPAPPAAEAMSGASPGWTGRILRRLGL